MQVLASSQKDVFRTIGHGLVLPEAHEEPKDVPDMGHLLLLRLGGGCGLQKRVVLKQGVCQGP